MKKLFTSLTTACVLGAAATSFAQPDAPWKLGYAYPGTPTIDGSIDAVWDAAVSHPMPNPVLDGAVDPGSPDMAASWRALYDDEYLYVLVEVTDDIVVPIGEGPDTVEVFVDGDYSRGVGTAWNAPGQDFVNDFQFGFGLDQYLGDPKPAVATGLYSSLLWSQESMAVLFEVAPTETGYLIEIAMEMVGFDFEAAGSFKDDPIAPSAGDVTEANFDQYRHIGFEVHAQESDTGTARELKMAWANSQTQWPSAPTGANGDYAWYQPVTFGTLIFVGDDVPPPCDLDWTPLAAESFPAWTATTAAGWIYAYNADWGFSAHLGTINTSSCNPLYQLNYDWLYRHSSSSDTVQWFYRYSNGAWIYVSASNGGWFQMTTDGGATWTWENFTTAPGA